MRALPRTLGELRQSEFSKERFQARSVKHEMRENLLAGLERNEPLFPGIFGYEDTVTPQIVNAILSQHNFILLGLRGQAKSRILRCLVDFLDPVIPVIEGCEINDNPYAPICALCRQRLQDEGDSTPIAFLSRERRYVEKLATPDVTIADIFGDIDPIKAARGGLYLSDEQTIHYGLLPRANRGIFAINELPDLAGKIQVGLFNIMQEGDVQIKGYPVRLPLDILLVFTANPEDYTARGKIITPLKDRIGSEIRTHYPTDLEHAIAITQQEAWLERGAQRKLHVPRFVKEIIEETAFLAREEKKIDRRSGVSQRMCISSMETAISNAELRAIRHKEPTVVPRVADIYAAVPSMTGKIELEYEGELRGAEAIARDLVRTAIGKVFDRYFADADLLAIVQWFDLGGQLKIAAGASSREVLEKLKSIQGLLEKIAPLGIKAKDDPAIVVSAAELVLEGLYAHRRISRSEERGFFAEEKKRVEPREDYPRQRRSFN